MWGCQTKDGCQTAEGCQTKDDCMKLAVNKGFNYYGLHRDRSSRSNPSGECEREDQANCQLMSESYINTKGTPWSLKYDFIKKCESTREASYCKDMSRENFLGDDYYWYVRRVLP